MPINVDRNIRNVNTTVESIMVFIETMAEIVGDEAGSKLATWLEAELINWRTHDQTSRSIT